MIASQPGRVVVPVHCATAFSNRIVALGVASEALGITLSSHATVFGRSTDAAIVSLCTSSD